MQWTSAHTPSCAKARARRIDCFFVINRLYYSLSGLWDMCRVYPYRVFHAFSSSCSSVSSVRLQCVAEKRALAWFLCQLMVLLNIFEMLAEFEAIPTCVTMYYGGSKTMMHSLRFPMYLLFSLSAACFPASRTLSFWGNVGLLHNRLWLETFRWLITFWVGWIVYSEELSSFDKR